MIVNVVYGFLGAGKTTFIKQVLEQPPADEKVVILVNEFGEVGVDGILLASAGLEVAEVVELPSGCICCTIASDFRRQFLELHERLNPDRIIIEPTGLATISQIKQILNAEDIQLHYSSLRVIHIVDASEFLSFVKSHRHFVENQIRGGALVVLNKIDKVKPGMVELLASSIKEINPDVRVYPTSFSRLASHDIDFILGTKSDPGILPDAVAHSEEQHVSEEEDHEIAHSLAHMYKSLGRTYFKTFSRHCLEDLFEDLRAGQYGEVIRAKGVLLTGEGWIKMEIASGEVHVERGPTGPASTVSIIGRDMKIEDIDLHLVRCQTEDWAGGM